MIPDYIPSHPQYHYNPAQQQHQLQHHHIQLHPDPYYSHTYNPSSTGQLTSSHSFYTHRPPEYHQPRHDSISSTSSTSTASSDCSTALYNLAPSANFNPHPQSPSYATPLTSPSISSFPPVLSSASPGNKKRRRGNLPRPVTETLRAWLHAHVHHPYPTDEEKSELMNQTGLTLNQISNWFINARRRQLPALSRRV